MKGGQAGHPCAHSPRHVLKCPTTEVGDLSFDHLVGAGELSPSVPAMLAVPVRRQSSREHQTSV